jgi:hypothetical protein
MAIAIMLSGTLNVDPCREAQPPFPGVSPGAVADIANADMANIEISNEEDGSFSISIVTESGTIG